MLELKVGDKLRDCDTRSKGVVKEIVSLNETYAWVRRVNTSGPTTRVSRERIHLNAERKKGYFWIGEMHLFSVAEPIKTEEEDMDVLRRAFERNG